MTLQDAQIVIQFLSDPKTLWACASAFVFVAIVITMLRLHFSPKYRNFDLLALFAVDQKTGKLSDSKIRLNFAFLLSSWAFVYLVMNDRFTEWFYFGFMGAWVTDRIFARMGNKQSQNDYNNSYNNSYSSDQYSGYDRRQQYDSDRFINPKQHTRASDRNMDAAYDDQTDADLQRQAGNEHRNG